MIIELEQNIENDTLSGVLDLVNAIGYKPSEVKTQDSHYLVCIGDQDFDIRLVGHEKGVKDVFRVSDSYKLVSRKWKADPSAISVGSSGSICEGSLSLIAGPCSIESEEQIQEVVQHLVENDIKFIRGGAFKPRTSPYAFRGLGLDGLRLIFEEARKHGICVVSEVMEISQIQQMYDYVDVYQVGARNSQNFSLLAELGSVDKPVLLKRGISGSIDELLQSAEYVFSSGNERLILCERGIRTFENAYRNTLDINAIPILKEKTHLPVIVDPSHGIGIRRHVTAVALAGLMAGADGVIYETHPNPEKAFSDAKQTLNFSESASLSRSAREVFDLKWRNFS